MSVTEALYYGVVVVAGLVFLLILLLLYASKAVLTSDSTIWRTIAYIVAVFDAWLIGAIFGVLSCNYACSESVEGGHGSAQN